MGKFGAIIVILKISGRGEGDCMAGGLRSTDQLREGSGAGENPVRDS